DRSSFSLSLHDALPIFHISQIANRHIGTPQEVLEEGQQIQVKVLDINEQEERMSLSIKELEKENETNEIKQYEKAEDQSGFQLGDCIGDQLNKYKNEGVTLVLISMKEGYCLKNNEN